MEPIRPQMPTSAEQLRSEHQAARRSILLDDWDETVEEWIDQHIPAERSDGWGVPDTSVNPLADLSRQLTTPGLYGVHPELTGHPGLLALVEGVWTRLQYLQYLAVGMGDYWLRPTIVDGSFSFRPVSPSDLYLEADPSRPDVPLHLRELRLRTLVPPTSLDPEDVYTWDVYELRPRYGGTYLRTFLAEGATPKLGREVTAEVMSQPDREWVPPEGALYPWRYADSTAYLPWQRYSPIDSGELHNHFEKRGAHRGTLNAALYATYTGHAARDCTGQALLYAGVTLPTEVSRTASGGRAKRSITFNPGALIGCTFSEDLQPGQQPWAKEIGAGANLTDLARFSADYVKNLAVRFGLNVDPMRNSANPASAQSLFISKEDKRMFAAQVEPCFRRADLALLRMCAAMATAEGLGVYPEDGYTITYQPIPRSPQEIREFREQLAWEVSSGLLSPIDEYRRLHPGVDDETAEAAIIKAAVDRARIAEAVTQATGRRAPPQQSDLADESDEDEPDDDRNSDENTDKEGE